MHKALVFIHLKSKSLTRPDEVLIQEIIQELQQRYITCKKQNDNSGCKYLLGILLGIKTFTITDWRNYFFASTSIEIVIQSKKEQFKYIKKFVKYIYELNNEIIIYESSSGSQYIEIKAKNKNVCVRISDHKLNNPSCNHRNNFHHANKSTIRFVDVNTEIIPKIINYGLNPGFNLFSLEKEYKTT